MVKKIRKYRTKEEIQSIKNHGPPLCSCRCGRYTIWNRHKKKWNIYIKNHDKKNKEMQELKKQNPPLCKCGCGNKVKFGKYSWNKYINGHNANRKNQKCSDIHKEKLSKSQINRWSNLENRILASCVHQKIKREDWNGFKRYEKYCNIFTDKEYREYILSRDNYTCQNKLDCKNNSKRISRHHIDYDKYNCSPNNLITVCNSCNARANFNKKFWIEYYNNRIKEIYE